MATGEKQFVRSTIRCEQCKTECKIENSCKGSSFAQLDFYFCSFDCCYNYSYGKNIELTIYMPKDISFNITTFVRSSIVLNDQTIEFAAYVQNGQPMISSNTLENTKLLLKHATNNTKFRALVNSYLK